MQFMDITFHVWHLMQILLEFKRSSRSAQVLENGRKLPRSTQMAEMFWEISFIKICSGCRTGIGFPMFQRQWRSNKTFTAFVLAQLQRNEYLIQYISAVHKIGIVYLCLGMCCHTSSQRYHSQISHPLRNFTSSSAHVLMFGRGFLHNQNCIPCFVQLSTIFLSPVSTEASVIALNAVNTSVMNICLFLIYRAFSGSILQPRMMPTVKWPKPELSALSSCPHFLLVPTTPL